MSPRLLAALILVIWMSLVLWVCWLHPDLLTY